MGLFDMSTLLENVQKYKALLVVHAMQAKDTIESVERFIILLKRAERAFRIRDHKEYIHLPRTAREQYAVFLAQLNQIDVDFFNDYCSFETDRDVVNAHKRACTVILNKFAATAHEKLNMLEIANNYKNL